MGSTALTIRSDGLDLVFFGALGLLLGQVLGFASGIISLIISLLSLIAFVYGLFLFRTDYRGRMAVAPQPPTPPPNVCPTCGGPLTFVEQYKRWYCQKEQKYV
ncbi:MAG: hypothetical protein KGI38_10620 [Thaumarchaeota archaeon]|nr:hypothetical protein [Nitrososphaerota archaeon]